MQRAFSVWPLLLVLLGGAALAVCQWLIFFYAPVEAQLGLMQKVHARAAAGKDGPPAVGIRQRS